MSAKTAQQYAIDTFEGQYYGGGPGPIAELTKAHEDQDVDIGEVLRVYPLVAQYALAYEGAHSETVKDWPTTSLAPDSSAWELKERRLQPKKRDYTKC